MKKKQLSRKQRALRNLATLVCVVLAMHLLNLYNFTPEAALRDRERELGSGKTEIIAWAEHTDATDIVLSDWEDRLLVSELRFDLLMGWRVDNSHLLRRDSSLPVQVDGSASGNEKETHLWLCGWVSDPGVEQLELRVHCRQWYGTGENVTDVYLTVTDFHSWQGERIFLLTSREIPATYTLHEVYLITEQGEELLFRA